MSESLEDAMKGLSVQEKVPGRPKPTPTPATASLPPTSLKLVEPPTSAKRTADDERGLPAALTPRTKIIQDFMQTEKGRRLLAETACIAKLRDPVENDAAMKELKAMGAPKDAADPAVMLGNIFFTFLEYTPVSYPSDADKKESMKRVVKLIESAKERVILFQLNFQIPSIAEALNQRAEEKVKIDVYMDFRDTDSPKNNQLNMLSSKINVHIVKFTDSEAFQFFHHKMVIADYRQICCGSMNLSVNSPRNNCEDYCIVDVNPVVFRPQIDAYIDLLESSKSVALS